jgi:hypothetical protein
MSTQQPQGADQVENLLPDPKQAYDHLYRNVHSEVFFGRLAQAGISPANEKEAQDLLDLGMKLRVAKQQKQAADTPDSFISRASRGLDNVLADAGIDTGIKSAAAQQQDESLDQVLEKLAADPDIYNSVLSLKSAEADDIRTHIESQTPNA